MLTWLSPGQYVLVKVLQEAQYLWCRRKNGTHFKTVCVFEACQLSISKYCCRLCKRKSSRAIIQHDFHWKYLGSKLESYYNWIRVETIRVIPGVDCYVLFWCLVCFHMSNKLTVDYLSVWGNMIFSIISNISEKIWHKLTFHTAVRLWHGTHGQLLVFVVLCLGLATNMKCKVCVWSCFQLRVNSHYNSLSTIQKHLV